MGRFEKPYDLLCRYGPEAQNAVLEQWWVLQITTQGARLVVLAAAKLLEADADKVSGDFVNGFPIFRIEPKLFQSGLDD